MTSTSISLDVLIVIFVCAKVFGYGPVDSWSWWLVLTPVWIMIGASFLVAWVSPSKQ